MVKTYYTTYKSVMRLFCTNAIEKLLEREGKVKILKNKKFEIWNSKFEIWKEWQTLIVFPDLWTIFNMVPAERLNDKVIKPSKESKWWNEHIAFLSATQTEKQKDIHRWEIKKGMKSVIICTYAEIFQDFHDLKKIIFVDPHKRYYANQQDPRYKVGDVLAQIAKLSWVTIETLGV